VAAARLVAYMPQLSFARHAQLEAEDEMVAVETLPTSITGAAPQKLPRRQSILNSLRKGLRRNHDLPEATAARILDKQEAGPPLLRRRSSNPELRPKVSKRAIASLPRQQTLKRSESEKRGKLLEVPSGEFEKKQNGVGQKRGWSAGALRRQKSPKPGHIPSASAPEVSAQEPNGNYGTIDGQLSQNDNDNTQQSGSAPSDMSSHGYFDCRNETTSDTEATDYDNDEAEETNDPAALQAEYARRWILNLSMSFRDKSEREKFFVTYAETPTRWRRLTISLDYRTAPPGSLEADLKSLHFQRDKSFRVFEAIRESLDDIQYYETVTNLKLETTEEDCQLHIHVREDANEIVQFPAASLMDHVQCPRYRESEVEFDSHLSGFVYKVRADGQLLIKKEIPGPDTVDEFLYEVNALDALYGANSVVQLRGLITDEDGSIVKGLLISYASRGALVDMLYDFGGELPWHKREKWARQIVEGLSNIHEAGFVQGDFTLSNIVIDDDENAQIIDINRRGCPVGWEPPELSRLIESGQRIAMHISVKTDLFQLGMVLWALATECDEPERSRPLVALGSEFPSYFSQIVDSCLEARPQGRMSASQLLTKFPRDAGRPPSQRPSVDFSLQPHVLGGDLKASDPSVATSHRSDKEYIDPKMAVTLDEVQRQRRVDSAKAGFTDQVTYLDPNSNPASTSYQFESNGSWIIGQSRGRSPVSSRRRRSSPYGRTATSVTSLSLSPDRRSGRSAKVYCDDLEDEPASYPAQLDDRDLVPGTEGCPTRCPSPPLNKRVTRVQRDQMPDFRPPMHQDSGFDEEMLNGLRLEDADVSSDQSTESEGEMDSEDEMPRLQPMGTRVKASNGALAAVNSAFAN
jgi:serine/threonine protein kinase